MNILMQNKFIEATIQRPTGNRVTDASLVQIDIPLYTSLLKSEKNWKEGDRNAITVFKSGGMSILLIAMHKGATITNHSASAMLSVQVIEGLIEVISENTTAIISTGQMLAIHKHLEHRINAIEETFILLTLCISEI